MFVFKISGTFSDRTWNLHKLQLRLPPTCQIYKAFTTGKTAWIHQQSCSSLVCPEELVSHLTQLLVYTSIWISKVCLVTVFWRCKVYLKFNFFTFTSNDQRLEALINDPAEGNAWHADHIIPVYRGGGESQPFTLNHSNIILNNVWYTWFHMNIQLTKQVFLKFWITHRWVPAGEHADALCGLSCRCHSSSMRRTQNNTVQG